jgi:hypothetical protein
MATAYPHRPGVQWTRAIAGLVTVLITPGVVGCRDSSTDKMGMMMERAQRQYSIAELQRAVGPVCEQYHTDTLVPVDSLPPQILSLSEARPGFAMMAGTEANGKGTLDVFWGGGGGGYGIRVCPVGAHLNTNRILRRLVLWGDGVAFYAE